MRCWQSLLKHLRLRHKLLNPFLFRFFSQLGLQACKTIPQCYKQWRTYHVWFCGVVASVEHGRDTARHTFSDHGTGHILETKDRARQHPIPKASAMVRPRSIFRMLFTQVVCQLFVIPGWHILCFPPLSNAGDLGRHIFFEAPELLALSLAQLGLSGDRVTQIVSARVAPESVRKCPQHALEVCVATHTYLGRAI